MPAENKTKAGFVNHVHSLFKSEYFPLEYEIHGF